MTYFRLSLHLAYHQLCRFRVDIDQTGVGHGEADLAEAVRVALQLRMVRFVWLAGFVVEQTDLIAFEQQAVHPVVAAVR